MNPDDAIDDADLGEDPTSPPSPLGAPPAIMAPTTASDSLAADAEIVIPDTIPILPIRDTVVFPGTIAPLTIGRPKSKKLVADVLEAGKVLGVVAQRDASVEDPGLDDLYRVGTVVSILKVLNLSEGNQSIIVHALMRFGIERMVQTEPYLKAVTHTREDTFAQSTELGALIETARKQAARVIEMTPGVPDDAIAILNNIEKPSSLADFLAANLSLGLVEKQELLETFDVRLRLRKINQALANQLEILELSAKIQTQVKSEIDKTQREYFLQEQLRAIRKELGESDGREAELVELRKAISEAKMPPEVEKEAQREMARLERMPQGSPEYSGGVDYLHWLCEMPWAVSTSDRLDIAKAERVLNEDHYGLQKVKRRILEFLAVRKLKPEGRGPILCFIGPPGVGKTSLGQSIARAIDRKFIRMSVGGVRDEADIRGHRRTYIGSVPGRIVQEIRKAGANNPVFMIDEVDKIGSDFRGDPSSALLEVLDPAQNSTFQDHYLAVPFDLSRVMFICTANYMDAVPPPLRDRMEVIAIPGYTQLDKLHIAKKYLVPRRRDENGLTTKQIRFSADSLRTIIESYTAEAGVRNLEREIGTVCRGVAAKIARKSRGPFSITPKALEEYLGPIKFERDVALRTSTPGVVTGLAWTPLGGEILFVEATAMPGKGAFQLTGQIGDVMKESVQAAYSIVRASARKYGISPEQLTKIDLHVHVPAGAIPKDGPSAGVAMFTALVSLLTQRPCRSDVAMTGEVTLRGLVLPIGGLKEKALAAHQAGIKTIIIPERNKRDLVEIPAEIRKQVRFVAVKSVDEVLRAALDKPIRPAGAAEAGSGEKAAQKKKPAKSAARRRKPARSKRVEVPSKRAAKSDASPSRRSRATPASSGPVRGRVPTRGGGRAGRPGTARAWR
ncbi:Lon protease 2 [Phycisphaerae bacterium RAS2]|nr:Lon protease 2 [Phycisphaerae bacterium RAS2]